MKALLTRSKATTKETLGDLVLRDANGKLILTLKTLELPWKNNMNKVSCIPVGKYKVVPRNSPKYGDHFHVLDVPNRSFILFHSGNYHTQIEGCILVGLTHADINGDGQLDVTSSKDAMGALLKLAPKGFDLEIV